MESKFRPSHPLFSTILTLYILFLLYSPPPFLGLLLSPVLPLTIVLLLTLLRFGSVQKPRPKTAKPQEPCPDDDHPETATTQPGKEIEVPFIGWDLKAPLEVIYEEYEGEGEDDLDQVSDLNRGCGERGEVQFTRIERWPSLSQYYPESDSDSDSDASWAGEFPTIGDWVLPEEEFGFGCADPERDGLIEIQLDRHHAGAEKKCENLDFHGEEENLIEIDISPPVRIGEFLTGKKRDARLYDEGHVTFN
ncbi:hypothetical protein CDL15_Pgr016933 [Punica granatum]|nr:hypothetical protein CDL15_Pgr016933 [Punica granatum]PKI74750.1 hypothetical protein CRG98_004859 [Punica granatum]